MSSPGGLTEHPFLMLQRQKLPCCDIASSCDIANCRDIVGFPLVIKSLASPAPSNFRMHVTLLKPIAAAVYRCGIRFEIDFHVSPTVFRLYRALRC